MKVNDNFKKLNEHLYFFLTHTSVLLTQSNQTSVCAHSFCCCFFFCCFIFLVRLVLYSTCSESTREKLETLRHKLNASLMTQFLPNERFDQVHLRNTGWTTYVFSKKDNLAGVFYWHNFFRFLRIYMYKFLGGFCCFQPLLNTTVTISPWSRASYFILLYFFFSWVWTLFSAAMWY